KSLRRQAGRAMLKLLPDTADRLGRRLTSGPNDDRVRAMQIAMELDLVEPLRDKLLPLCSHTSPRVRSKAVTLLATLGASAVDMLLEKAANDPDARVRANAIEVMEDRGPEKFVPVLSEKARSGQNRERANAIKAMHRMKTGVVHNQLLAMLKDGRPEHRVSALWCLRRIGWWQLLREVAQLARDDSNLRVKRYAMTILQTAAAEVQAKKIALAA
ncbi:MAG TPA: HEAT repeat domain-containing protein, partial [Tepidisphaeraceae bacterium]|nr:HEAT repeat domain-containing protein [Tepidisphaeraceae bacterium]